MNNTTGIWSDMGHMNISYGFKQEARVGDRIRGYDKNATVIAIDLTSRWPLKVHTDDGCRDGFNPAYCKLLARADDTEAHVPLASKPNCQSAQTPNVVWPKRYDNVAAMCEPEHVARMETIHRENKRWLQHTSLLAPKVARDDYDDCCAPAQ